LLLFISLQILLHTTAHTTAAAMRVIILQTLVLAPYCCITSSFAIPIAFSQRSNGRIPALNLFFDNGDKTVADSPTKSRSGFGVDRRTIENLQNNPTIPIQFEYSDPSGSQKIIQIKQLEKDTVADAVSLCLKEYGSYPSSITANATPFEKMVEERMSDFDNFFFTFIVLLGLGQRVERREKSDKDPSCPQDHNVLCISEIDSNQKETMFGMAEVSMQPPDPSRTSPPFVMPSYLKKVLASFYGSDSLPYISNVLITNEYRGKGFSKVLMAACEGLAKSWGYYEAYLHVDADSSSGGPAQNLYNSLGYEPVIDETYNENFTWMGSTPAMNRGLYIVDGVALLFLKKKLLSKENKCI